MAQSTFVKSFDWVQEALETEQIHCVDASWYLPAQKRNAASEYSKQRLAGAVFFDLDAISDKSNALPHMMPPVEQFADATSAMGLSNQDTILIYDGPGFFSAPRVWWMFRVFGAKNVFLLDGGFDRWVDEGRPVETGSPKRNRAGCFVAEEPMQSVTDLNEMKRIVADRNVQIADARGAGRFSGTEPEPRPGMRSGHMPGSFNVPFSSLLDGDRLKPVQALKETLTSAGLDLTKPVVTTCGSGVTAATITLALLSLGHDDNTLYDGSWSEWGSRTDTDVASLS